MDFKTKITVIFLEYTKQTIDFDYFIDEMVELIESQRVKGYWEQVVNATIKDQNYRFLKTVYSFSITIFESFNRDFFNEISKKKKLSNKKFKNTPSKILKFFKNNFKVDLEQGFRHWEELKETICRRNVITHNMGKIDRSYIDCIKCEENLIDKMIGKDISHNVEYIKNTDDIIGKYLVFTFKKVTQFYNIKGIKSLVKEIAADGYFSDVNPDLLDDVEIQ